VVNSKEVFHFFHVEAVKHIEHVIAVAEGSLLIFSHKVAGHGHQLIIEELSKSFAQVFLHASLQFLALEALEESHGLSQLHHHAAGLLDW